MIVSVNAYEDADLLENCLASVREQIPDAAIQVVDGRYAAFRPDAADNSTDGTRELCRSFDAEYYPDGPFDNEQAKHWGRIDRAPDGDRVLFIDADERVLTFDADCVAEDVVARVRIHNALMYGEGDVTYYPRWFKPEWMEDIPRVDRFSFTQPVRRTDSITLTHRADLRSDAYREAKLDRFEREDRDPWYAEYLRALEERGHAAAFVTCPNCARESVTQSRICGYDDRFTRVETCTAADQCYATVVPVHWDGEYRYLPDRIDEGFDTDPERMRLELMDAGNDIARVIGPRKFERYRANAKIWARQAFADDAPVA